MKKAIYTILAVASLLQSLQMQAAADKEKADSTASCKKSKYEQILEKQTGCAEGMFTIRLSDGKVYFEIPDSLLGREFLMGSTIKSISDNGNGVVGSRGDLIHFTFTRQDSTLMLREISSTYVSSEGGIGEALSRSNIGPVKSAFSPAGRTPDSTYVYDLTSVFLEHDKKMSPFLDISVYASYSRKESFKKELSYISGISAFHDNVSVTSTMSYTYNMSRKGADKPLLENQPLTAVMTRSILLLPREAYHPRRGDWRIGYFHTERERLGSVVKSSHTEYFTNRWRLEPSDTLAYMRGEKVEPVKPIVFYIDSDFPEWWKPYIREAVNQWNEPFEAIGFRNAVVARDFPEDDPSFDPDNIRYSCIRYAPIGVQNAMGPSWTDPRSGEILTASVYVYHDVIKLLSRWIFVQTAQADTAVRHSDIPREILGDGLRYVIAHEVGHCLGLMHNMSASSVIPVESLRDPQFTSENGTTTSIMDYARFNYVAQPGDMEKGVKMTPPRFGKYDRYAIRWAYTPIFGAEDFEQEAAVTSSWITDSLKAAPFYRYGKQQFYSTLFDPRAQNEDLGDNAVRATGYGVKNLKYIMSNLMDWAGDDDDDYSVRLDRYNGIVNQYLAYSQHVLLNVGGLYKNDVKAADDMPAFLNIPRNRQMEALEYAFEMENDLGWVAPKAVVDRLPIVGSPERAMHKSIQDVILMTPFLASKSDGVVTEELSSAELLDIIFDRVWAPTKKGKRLTDNQRDFQKNFVRTYMGSAGYSYPGAGRNAAVAADAVEVCPEQLGCFALEGDMERLGHLTYSPVSGYEWLPRAIFNTGDITQADIYGLLLKARKTVVSHRGGACAADKAHYDLIISAIDQGLGL